MIVAQPSAAPPAVKRGEFSLDNVSVSPSSTHTLAIPLGSDRYTHGMLQMHIPSVVGVTGTRRRKPSAILFERDPDKTNAQSEKARTVVCCCGYYVTVYRREGYRFGDSGQLSYVDWAASSGQLRINRVWIDGSDLKIEMYNTHGYYTAKLYLRGTYRAEQ